MATSIDDLPRLTDDDREALDNDYTAIASVLTNDPPADSPDFERWRDQVVLDVADELAANHSGTIPEGPPACACEGCNGSGLSPKSGKRCDECAGSGGPAETATATRTELDKPTRIAGIAGSRRTGHAIVHITRFEIAGASRSRRYRVSLRRWAALRDRLIGGIGPYRCSGAWLRSSLDVSVWTSAASPLN